MKLFIFSIGGSGSRVVRSLCMLMAAGVPHFKAGDQVFPIMIDYDVDNGDTKRAFKCVDAYNTIHNSAFPKELEKTAETETETEKNKTDYRFFHTALMQMSDMGDGYNSSYTLQFRHNKEDKTFGDAIAFERLRNEKKGTADLLKTLFDTSNTADTEMGIDMTVGFKGNPNIGSVVFNNLKDTSELKDFFRCCEPGDKVILIGSLFGGTGASGIPEITKAIRSNSRTANVHLGVVMLTPYFCFDQADEVGSVKSGLFDSKTRAALSFYHSSEVNKKIDSIYYIGDKERTKMPYCLGGEGQQNNSHIVDLLGAMSVLHFFKSDKATDLMRYKYRMHNNEPNHAPGFTILNFYSDDYKKIIRPLVTFAFALKFFLSEIAMKTKDATSLAYSQAFGLKAYFTNGRVGEPTPRSKDGLEEKDKIKYEPGLHATLYSLQQFGDQFIEWVDELKKIGNHRLMMFDFKQPIVSLVQDCKLSSMVKSKLGWGPLVEKELVEPLDFSEAIQKRYAVKYQDAAPAGGPLHFKNTTAGYALLDCLRLGIEDILNKSEIAQKLKFQ